MTTEIHTSPATPQSPSRTVFKDAYDALAAEIAAVPADRLVTINIDIDAAVITARGAMPEVLAQLDAMKRQLPEFDHTLVLRLERYALALFHLNAEWRMAAAPVEDLPSLAAQAAEMRDVFVADARALARRGLLDGAALDGRPQGPGYKTLVAELYAVVALLRGAWSRIEGRTAISADEFAEAEALADRISLAMGLREQSPSALASAASLERQRAFSLFVRAYDQVRRAVSYLRWDADDVDSVMPSLYAGRGSGRKSKDASRGQEAEASTSSALLTHPLIPVMSTVDAKDSPFLPE